MAKQRITDKQKLFFVFLQRMETEGLEFSLQQLADATGYPMKGTVKAKMSRNEWDAVLKSETNGMYRAKEVLGLTLEEFAQRISTKKAVSSVDTASSLSTLTTAGMTAEKEQLGTYDWEPVSIFISHQAIFKVEVAALKRELEHYGTKCFVAHEDIEPTKKWLKQIKRAIKDCHALVALLTTDFRDSVWTDHEIGMALGLKKVVIPVVLGRYPYGFMASIQALKGDLNRSRSLAESIIDALLKNEATSSAMKSAIYDSFFHSASFDTAIRTSKLLVQFDHLSEMECDLLAHAVRANDQIYRAVGVRKRMEEFLTRHRFSTIKDTTA